MFPFSSCSPTLALKSSLKSHQMTILFVPNDKVFTQMMIFSLTPLFSAKKVVILWLFNDDLKEEPEILRLNKYLGQLARVCFYLKFYKFCIKIFPYRMFFVRSTHFLGVSRSRNKIVEPLILPKTVCSFFERICACTILFRDLLNCKTWLDIVIVQKFLIFFTFGVKW